MEKISSNTAGCLWSGLPGGLFIPTLSTGALRGAVLGILWSHVAPADTQGPISAIVMMMELTENLSPLIIPLALASAGATVVSRRLCNASIYRQF